MSVCKQNLIEIYKRLLCYPFDSVRVNIKYRIKICLINMFKMNHSVRKAYWLVCHVVGRGFTSRLGHIKDHHKNGTNYLPAWHAG